jgi:hypothetical protein
MKSSKALSTEEIYEAVRAIDYVTQDEFSKEYCGRSASYLRTIRAKNLELSTDVLVRIADTLIKKQESNTNIGQHQVRLVESTLNRLAQMIFERQTNHGHLKLRQMLVRIVERISDDESRSVNYPPIIIC